MKKAFLTLSIVFVTILATNAQEKGDFRFGVYGQALTSGNTIFTQYGVTGEYFLSHNFSLNYKYGMGTNPEHDLMGHINVSAIGVAFAAVVAYELVPYMFLIPEGISYHAYPNERFEIAPYVNPLGAEINLDEEFPILLSCAFGLNLHVKPTEDFSISPNAGAILIYKTGEVFPVFGLSINYNFRDIF